MQWYVDGEMVRTLQKISKVTGQSKPAGSNKLQRPATAIDFRKSKPLTSGNDKIHQSKISWFYIGPCQFDSLIVNPRRQLQNHDKDIHHHYKWRPHSRCQFIIEYKLITKWKLDCSGSTINSCYIWNLTIVRLITFRIRRHHIPHIK